MSRPVERGILTPRQCQSRRQSSDPSAPLIDDARLCKKLTLHQLRCSVFNLHFNAFRLQLEVFSERLSKSGGMGRIDKI